MFVCLNCRFQYICNELNIVQFCADEGFIDESSLISVLELSDEPRNANEVELLAAYETLADYQYADYLSDLLNAFSSGLPFNDEWTWGSSTSHFERISMNSHRFRH